MVGYVPSSLLLRISLMSFLKVFTANMWNGIDMSYSVCFFVYFCLLVSGRGEAGHAILACGAVLLFPRPVRYSIIRDSSLKTIK
jgi:hypothetical protein